jgi:hypothetical protein
MTLSQVDETYRTHGKNKKWVHSFKEKSWVTDLMWQGLRFLPRNLKVVIFEFWPSGLISWLSDSGFSSVNILDNTLIYSIFFHKFINILSFFTCRFTTTHCRTLTAETRLPVRLTSASLTTWKVTAWKSKYFTYIWKCKILLEMIILKRYEYSNTCVCGPMVWFLDTII